MENLLSTAGHAPAEPQPQSWDDYIKQLDEEWLLISLEDARDALVYSEDVPQHIRDSYCCLSDIIRRLRSPA